MATRPESPGSVRVNPKAEVVDQILVASRAQRFLDFRRGRGRGTIRAEELRNVCLMARDECDPYGIRIANATISGVLDLEAANVPVPLHFLACRFTEAPRLTGADLHELSITTGQHGSVAVEGALPGSLLSGLLANGVHIRRDLVLSGTLIGGAHRSSASLRRTAAVWLTEAQIGGQFLAIGTEVRATGDRAMHCDRLRVSGDLRLIHGFQVNREIRLLAMQLAGSLDLTASSLLPDGNLALDLAEAVIGGSLFIRDGGHAQTRPRINGHVEMSGAKIMGSIQIRNANLTGSAGQTGRHAYDQGEPEGCLVLSAPHLTVHGEFAIEGDLPVQGGSPGQLGTLVQGGLKLRGCDLRGGLRIDHQHLRNQGGVALDLSQAELGGRLSLRTCEIGGTVNIANARIAGHVDLSHSKIQEPRQRRALIAIGAQIGGDVLLTSFISTAGSLNFRGASIGGVVDAEAAKLSNVGDKTLSLHQAHVAGNVRLCKEFSSTGLVVLNRAIIDGRLRCDGATLIWQESKPPLDGDPEPNLRGSAIEAISTTVRSGIALGWTVDGAVDFTDARTSYLADNADSDWPEYSYLTGFTYERFAPLDMRRGAGVWSAAARSQWLGRLQPTDPQPWEQAARVLRLSGDRSGAEDILIAQRRCARRRRLGDQRHRYRRFLDTLQELLVGYGYRPQRTLLVLLALIVMVALILSIPTMRASMRATAPEAVVSPDITTVSTDAGSCGGGRVHCLNPVLYAIDTVVPIIDLGQRSTWYPGRSPAGTFMSWLLNLSTILGWIASTVFALSFARLGRISVE